jgi:D-ribose pyranase
MIRHGILNPQLLSLLARVRHTNQLVIADRGFPYWPAIETVDISLVDNIPTMLQVLNAIRENVDISRIYMASEFRVENTEEIQTQFAQAMVGIPVALEPHEAFKTRVPGSIGLIRTGETIQFSNMILVSGRVDPVFSVH